MANYIVLNEDQLLANLARKLPDVKSEVFLEAIKMCEVEQEQKQGHWIFMETSSGRDSWKCSVCGRRARGKLNELPYCHCGARMSEVEQ